MPTEARVKMSGGNLMRFGRSKQSGFMRLGRAKNSDFMRFGRSPGNLMRFGRSSGNLMRFGRANNNLMRFGRANNNLMRFGRGGNNLMRFGRANNNLMRFGRANSNLMRFGRANNNLMRFGRANNNLMRFGRSDEDFVNYETDPNFEEFNEEEQMPTIASESYARVERSAKDPPEPKAANYADRKNDNFMRLGRSLLQKNYEDEEDDSQDSAETNDKEANEKLKMYIDENYMRMGGNNMDNQDADAFDILFPEESRKKRSLVKKAEKGAGTNAELDKKPDVKGVRLVHSVGTSKCGKS